MAYDNEERKERPKRRERRDGDRQYHGKKDSGGHFSGKRDDRRPRDDKKRSGGDSKPRDHDSRDFKTRSNYRNGDRKPRERGSDKGGYRDRDSKPRSGERRPFRNREDRDSRPRNGDRRSFNDRRDRGARSDSRTFDREKAPREERADSGEETRRLTLPKDASRLLNRGIDCLVKGDDNTAMIMFLHGSVMMSEGCRNNAERILREAGKDSFQSIRSDIGPNCSEEALIEFDYLCIERDKGYDRTFFENEYSKQNTHAIYRKICLEEVEGDDPIIDVFASRYPEDKEKVVKGLDLLRRKKDSQSAEAHLTRIEDAIKLKQSVNVMFTRAMNGDARAVQELKENSKKVPEAAFYSEFLVARSEGNQVEWLRAKYPQYKDLIIAKQGEFKIQDTPFGMYLKAKSLESKKEEYMSVMMNSARAGCQEAIDELSTKMFRNDVRKCLAGIYLKENDLQNLMVVYQAGLDDMYYLDQYCGDNKERILEVGAELGKQSVSKEIDWLKDHYDKGMNFCKDALIEKSHDDFYHTKKMVYALHDIGADMDAAKLYFDMEGNPEIPSVKWLKKVCADEETKEFVRQHYEERGEPEVFDSIFEEDGYESRPKRKVGGPKKFGGKPRRRYRLRWIQRHIELLMCGFFHIVYILIINPVELCGTFTYRTS